MESSPVGWNPGDVFVGEGRQHTPPKPSPVFPLPSQLLSGEAGALGSDLASSPVEFIKCTQVWVCSFFTMLNGQG